MRTSRLFYTMLLSGCMGFILNACTNDEPSYEEVATVDEAQYYITGRVETNGIPAPGITVSAHGLTSAMTDATGMYLLQSKEKGQDFVLSFSAPGYVTIQGVVSLPNNMPGNSSRVLNATLAKQGAQVWIDHDQEKNITPTEGITFVIPANAIKTDQNIRISAAPTTTGEKSIALSEIVCAPEGLALQKPATLIIDNLTSGEIAFENPEVYIKNPITLEWEKNAIATFNPQQNTYTAPLSQLGCYMLRPKYNINKGAVTTPDEINGQIEVNNYGNLYAKRNVTFEIKQKTGWLYIVRPEEAIESILPAISSDDKNGLKTQIETMVCRYTGCSEGIFTLPRQESVNVSGNAHLIYTNIPKQREDVLTIPITFKDQKMNLAVKIKQYVGESVKYELIPDDIHSGGGGH